MSYWFCAHERMLPSRNTVVSRKHLSTLAIGAAAIVISSVASAQITIVPSPASANHPLQITVNSVAPSSWANVQDTSYDVTSDTVRIDATVDLGPFAYPSPYEFTITVPPIEPGEYDVQYWSTYVRGGSQSGPTMRLTTTLQVAQNLPVPTLPPLGILILVAAVSTSGWLVLRRLNPRPADPSPRYK